MRTQDFKDYDDKNRAIIAQLIKDSMKNNDDISGSVLATMAQFIMNLKLNFVAKGKGRDWLSPEEIIESQVEELRRCIIDLEAYKLRLEKGATVQ
jgi:hypothetical protein